jgi:hypothetical protein
LAFGETDLPRWTLLVAALLALGTGFLMGLGSLKVPHCRRCGRALRPAVLRLKPEAREQARQAVAAQDAGALAQLARPAPGEAAVDVHAALCPRCRNVALVRVGAFPSIPPAANEIWQGEPATALTRLMGGEDAAAGGGAAPTAGGSPDRPA